MLETLLAILALDFPCPTIILEEDGDIGLEWFEAADSQLSVSINSTGGMNYAGMLGEEHPHGFTTEIKVVRKLLAELYNGAKG